MASSLCRLLILKKIKSYPSRESYVANMSFNAIRGDKIIAKISECTVLCQVSSL